MSDVETMAISISGCARCGATHDVVFQHFKGNSFEDANGIVFDWWGLCPVTGDPVLMTNKDPDLIDVTPDDKLPKRPDAKDEA